MSLAMEQVKTTTERDPRWRSVINRDAAADGTFVYAVKSTGVYCRPSCPSRPAKPKNVTFYATCAEAEAAGYRACRRCNPKGPSLSEADCRGGRGSLPAIEDAEELPKLDAARRLRGHEPVLFPSPVQGDHRSDAEGVWRGAPGEESPRGTRRQEDQRDERDLWRRLQFEQPVL